MEQRPTDCPKLNVRLESCRIRCDRDWVRSRERTPRKCRWTSSCPLDTTRNSNNIDPAIVRQYIISFLIWILMAHLKLTISYQTEGVSFFQLISFPYIQFWLFFCFIFSLCFFFSKSVVDRLISIRVHLAWHRSITTALWQSGKWTGKGSQRRTARQFEVVVDLVFPFADLVPSVSVVQSLVDM